MQSLHRGVSPVITVRMPKKDAAKTHVVAGQKGLTRSEWLRALIYRELNGTPCTCNRDGGAE